MTVQVDQVLHFFWFLHFCRRLSEGLALLGIMAAQSGVPLQCLDTMLPGRTKGFRGALNRPPWWQDELATRQDALVTTVTDGK